jgi:alpha-mannosidase
MRISLLRSPTMPDPVADQGEHRFAYSLLPHNGGWDERTIGAAYALNDPLLVWQSQTASAPIPDAMAGALASPFLSVNQPNVVIETIKQAEDGNGLIVRLYDSQRRRGKATLTAAFELDAAWQTNLIEDDQAVLAIEGKRVELYFKPYEIKTLRLIPAIDGQMAS